MMKAVRARYTLEFKPEEVRRAELTPVAELACHRPDAAPSKLMFPSNLLE
jgi:hypothetical protein